MSPSWVFYTNGFMRCSLCLLVVSTVSTGDTHPDDLEDPSAMLYKAIALVEQGLEQDGDPELLDEAESLARRAVELQPQNATLHVGLGEILMATNENRAAEEAFAAAVKLSPADAEAHYLFGMSRGLQGNYFAAEEPLRQAVDLDADKIDYHLALGSALGNLGKYALSERSLGRALRLGAVEDAEDQLRKLYAQDGRVQMDTSARRTAVEFEAEAGKESDSDGVSAALWSRLAGLREYEMTPEWQRQRLTHCAANSDESPCNTQTIFYEGWQKTWTHAQALITKPSGKHAVLNGGLGAVCLFAFHLAHAGACEVVEDGCEVHGSAAAAAGLASSAVGGSEAQPPMGLVPPSISCTLKATSADVFWVLDVGHTSEAQAALERKLGDVLSAGDSVILFREPRLEDSGLRLVSNESFTPHCAGTVNDKCYAWRPLVSWGAGKNLTVFVLQAVGKREEL